MQRGYSLKWLFVSAAAVGAGCLALRNASYDTNGYLLLCVVAALAICLVGALVRTGRPRAFWIGAAIFGWIAFLVNGPAHSLLPNLALPTDQAIAFLHSKVSQSLTPDEAIRQGWYPAEAFSASRLRHPIAVPMLTHFSDAAHCLMTLVAACFGGLMGRRFYRLNSITTEPGRAAN